MDPSHASLLPSSASCIAKSPAGELEVLDCLIQLPYENLVLSSTQRCMHQTPSVITIGYTAGDGQSPTKFMTNFLGFGLVFFITLTETITWHKLYQERKAKPFPPRITSCLSSPGQGRLHPQVMAEAASSRAQWVRDSTSTG